MNENVDNENLDFKIVLDQASETYLSKDYEESAALYDALTEQYPDNPFLLINAGNSHYKSKEYGKALGYYMHAKRMMPRNKEVNNNLSVVMDDIELNQPPIVTFSYVTWLESFLLFLVFNILFLFRKKLFSRSTQRMVFSFVCLLALLQFAYVSYEQKVKKLAVVTEVSVQAYSGDGIGYSKLFELFDGQIVEIMRREDEWSKIKIDGSLGWIKNTALEVI